MRKLWLTPLLLVSLGLQTAIAAQRAPAGLAVRTPYSWSVNLESTTKAVVGPILAEQLLKVRLEIQSATNADALIPEMQEVTLCILEHYCRTVSLFMLDADLTPLLLKRVNTHGAEKLYLSIQNTTLKAGESLNLTVSVETDSTQELPNFIDATSL